MGFKPDLDDQLVSFSAFRQVLIRFIDRSVGAYFLAHSVHVASRLRNVDNTHTSFYTSSPTLYYGTVRTGPINDRMDNPGHSVVGRLESSKFLKWDDLHCLVLLSSEPSHLLDTCRVLPFLCYSHLNRY